MEATSLRASYRATARFVVRDNIAFAIPLAVRAGRRDGFHGLRPNTAKLPELKACGQTKEDPLSHGNSSRSEDYPTFACGANRLSNEKPQPSLPLMAGALGKSLDIFRYKPEPSPDAIPPKQFRPVYHQFATTALQRPRRKAPANCGVDWGLHTPCEGAWGRPYASRSCSP
jgi:hypothetical protein